MRITQSMISNQTLGNIQNNYGELSKLQEQISTGTKISRPSEDPVLATNAMRYRTELREIDQFQRNTSVANLWMQSSDNALYTVNQTIQRIREITVQASNDTYDQAQRQDMAEEVKQLISHIEDLANTKVNNNYIFNGTDATNPPVNLDTQEFPDHTDLLNVELMNGVEVPINVNADQLFRAEMFRDLQELERNLRDPETSDRELDDFLRTIDGHLDEVLRTEAQLGARINRVEMIEDRLSEQKEIATKVMSDNENVDMAAVITDLITQESVHQAALSAGARIIQPNLIDFLR
ncbi:flagellar hook-associated protein 3 FlgL [Geomicrobium halophilum]|uniref:Flagellar hook-associated protein 3 FlgL n=1 Tax=Geomicrobium halophilum TaxID=549000 RepID=A0A841PVK9_9BACL|nr:flagellar hook-associated protein FlgL [Geomicrobium halophilum]MBB6450371.1 flagellar hook-associated protein 3 FlgL [Geomicrobium halophilum]